MRVRRLAGTACVSQAKMDGRQCARPCSEIQVVPLASPRALGFRAVQQGGGGGIPSALEQGQQAQALEHRQPAARDTSDRPLPSALHRGQADPRTLGQALLRPRSRQTRPANQSPRWAPTFMAAGEAKSAFPVHGSGPVRYRHNSSFMDYIMRNGGDHQSDYGHALWVHGGDVHAPEAPRPITVTVPTPDGPRASEGVGVRCTSPMRRPSV